MIIKKEGYNKSLLIITVVIILTEAFLVLIGVFSNLFLLLFLPVFLLVLLHLLKRGKIKRIDIIMDYRFIQKGREVSLNELYNMIPCANRIKLYPNDNIVWFDIRSEECYYKFREKEYSEFHRYLSNFSSVYKFKIHKPIH